jgi:hypothetical protein
MTEGQMNPAACWCPEKGWTSRSHECGAEYCQRLRPPTQEQKLALIEQMGDEMLLAVHRASRMPKPRREPFPNPEAAKWRPKV